MKPKKNPKVEAARVKATAPLPPEMPTETTAPAAPVTPVPPGIRRSPNDLPGIEYFPARGGSAEATDVLRASSPVADPDEMVTFEDWEDEYGDGDD